MEKINIVYVDDSPEMFLNLFLSSYQKNEVIIRYSSVVFEHDDSYKTLLGNPTIRDANIIFIDSRLFENRGAGGVFSGEEFKLILKKIFPYIEVIVISQKAIGEGFQTIAKYDLEEGLFNFEEIKKSALDFYSRAITTLLEEKIQNVIEFRKILERIQSEEIDQFLVENIQNSIKGTDEYDQLSTEDLDKVIAAFHELASKIELRDEKDGL